MSRPYQNTIYPLKSQSCQLQLIIHMHKQTSITRYPSLLTVFNSKLKDYTGNRNGIYREQKLRDEKYIIKYQPEYLDKYILYRNKTGT